MKNGQQFTGHPVNVATGVVFSTHTDISIPGALSLTWERQYDTGLLDSPSGPLGPGWVTPFFAQLTPGETEYRFLTPEGYVEVFRDPERGIAHGEVVRNLGTFQELRRDSLGLVVTRWDIETGKIERFLFREGISGQPWHLHSIEDATGRGLDLLRDRNARLVGIRQRLEERTLQLVYNEQALISKIIFLGRTGERHTLAEYEYDPLGRLVAAFDALGNAERYQYDAGGRMTRQAARDGSVFSFRYDAKGRCVRTSGLDRYDEKTLRYHDSVRITEVTDSYGQVTRYQCLPTGQVVSRFEPLGAETKTEYDEHGRVSATITSLGATTRYEYDEVGNRSKITNPLGNSFTPSFNGSHQPVKVVDPKGNVWKRKYDSANRLVNTVDPNGAQWSIDYDADGNSVGVRDPKGAHRTLRYEHGVLIEFSDWKGNLTRLQTDALGRVVKRIAPLGYTLSFTYDLLGNPTQVALPDGNTIRASFDSASNLSRLVDARGFTKQFRYGPCRRLLERVDQNGNAVKYVWGTEPGRLEHVINERDEAYTFIHDDAGRVIREISFDGREYAFAYNADDWCIAVTNGNGEVIHIRRDLEGRILEQQLPDGGFAKYTYDEIGLAIEAANQDSVIKVEYDPCGRPLRETQGEYWVQSRYDLVGNRTRMETSLGHSVDCDLDPNGRPTTIATSNDKLLKFTWNELGREVLRSLPGFMHLEQDYDLCGRLVEQGVGGRGVPRTSSHAAHLPARDLPIHRLYTRNEAGAPVSIEDNYWGTTEYTYDPAARLTRVMRSHGVSEVFDYDPTGNITRIRNSGEISTEDVLSYSPGNRLLEKNGTTYHYDAQGRLVKKIERKGEDHSEVWTYTWDGLDQLSSVTRPDGQTWEYKYDAFGRRVEKKGPGQTTQFVWDGDVLAHEVRVEAQQLTSWIFSEADLTPLAKIEGSEFYSIIPDHLGTPREMIDTRGRVVWRHRTQAYGGELHGEKSEIENPIRFPGQYFDTESGLCYNRFRYYDPECGRFIQQDPVMLDGGNNPYWYVTNPIAWFDLFGLNASCESGKRGRAKAKEDLKKAGFTHVADEVTMTVIGTDGKPVTIRADFVYQKGDTLYVFEVKNGAGGLTKNQTASGLFDMSNPANQNGAIRTSGGSSPPGQQGPFTVATNNRPAVGDKGDTKTATFAVLKYDGEPGSRVD